MKKMTFEDYVKALDGAGSITRRNVLARALVDKDIDTMEMGLLVSYAYGGETSCPD